MAVAVKPEIMLQATKFAVGFLGRGDKRRRYQAKLSGNTQKRDITEVMTKFWITMRVAKHQILDNEFDINEPSQILFDVKKGFVF